MWIDALTHKVREGGRTVNVHALIATGVTAAGYREILGIDVTSSEDGAGWRSCAAWWPAACPASPLPGASLASAATRRMVTIAGQVRVGPGERAP